jgi:hypothetical protein
MVSTRGKKKRNKRPTKKNARRMKGTKKQKKRNPKKKKRRKKKKTKKRTKFGGMFTSNDSLVNHRQTQPQAPPSNVFKFKNTGNPDKDWNSAMGVLSRCDEIIKSVDFSGAHLTPQKLQKLCEIIKKCNSNYNEYDIKELLLNDCKIDDVTPLQILVNLNHLELNGNQIVDVTPLRGLVNLNHLELNDNKIVDVTPLKDLGTIVHLILNDLQIVDVAPLKDGKIIYIELNKNIVMVGWFIHRPGPPRPNEN